MSDVSTRRNLTGYSSWKFRTRQTADVVMTHHSSINAIPHMRGAADGPKSKMWLEHLKDTPYGNLECSQMCRQLHEPLSVGPSKPSSCQQ